MKNNTFTLHSSVQYVIPKFNRIVHNSLDTYINDAKLSIIHSFYQRTEKHELQQYCIKEWCNAFQFW